MELLHDRYQVEQSLGKKAGRQTLLVRDLQTQELVVELLTFNHESKRDDLKRFEREALEQPFKAGRSFSADVQQLGRSLLEILIHLHSQQPPVIHRDI